MPNILSEEDWEILVARIKDGKCTPFLGAGVCAGYLPMGSELAEKMAEKYKYPFPDDRKNLAMVSQYTAVSMNDPMWPKEFVCKCFREDFKPPDLVDPDDPHRVLAKLPLPIYLTTNYDDCMLQALAKVPSKKPQREVCRWNSALRNAPSILEGKKAFKPSTATPLVFHLHGYLDILESLVLTEDDYLDFLVSYYSRENFLPPQIKEAITKNSLLFIGYSLKDWNFRILFRVFKSTLEKSLTRSHVSVQLIPDGLDSSYTLYLEKYFNKIDVKVYWGTAKNFAKELGDRLE